MQAQIAASILVGLAISALLFLPLLVWQYRRYGRFDAMRMAWTAASYIYLAAVVAFTIFPLPRFSPDYCSMNATTPLWDPLRFPRDLIDLVRARGLLAALTSSLVWEFTMNMALFIPFGLIVRRVLEWPRPVVLLAALATSVLIEATQFTGNWGLAPCSYRFADATDLITNTTGALIGLALERITPRLLSTKKHLLDRRDRARPITRIRRLVGMFLDIWYLGLATLVGGTTAATLYVLSQGGSSAGFTPTQLMEFQDAIVHGAWTATMVVTFLPALTGTGASFGQRTVYLCPQTSSQHRIRRLLRAATVQGAIPTMLLLGFPSALLAPLWGLAAITSLLVDPRGLSYRLSGCRLADARAQAC